MHDYSAYATSGHNSAADIKEIIKLAQEQLKAEILVEKLEEDLKTAKEKLRNISENLLPGKMEELGLPEIATPDGIQVKIKDKIEAYVSKERRPLAHDWLEKNGFGGIIKSEVIAPFGRDEIKQAHELVIALNKSGRLANLERSVHAQTLLAFVKEQLTAGKDIPVDTFGVRRTRVSKIDTKNK